MLWLLWRCGGGFSGDGSCNSCYGGVGGGGGSSGGGSCCGGRGGGVFMVAVVVTAYVKVAVIIV